MGKFTLLSVSISVGLVAVVLLVEETDHKLRGMSLCFEGRVVLVTGAGGGKSGMQTYSNCTMAGLLLLLTLG